MPKDNHCLLSFDPKTFQPIYTPPSTAATVTAKKNDDGGEEGDIECDAELPDVDAAVEEMRSLLSDIDTLSGLKVA